MATYTSPLPTRYSLLLFFFHDPATTELYTLSLHDALPIFALLERKDGNLLAPQHVDHALGVARGRRHHAPGRARGRRLDRKSTRLNSSHVAISYAVFCLKKKKKKVL